MDPTCWQFRNPFPEFQLRFAAAAAAIAGRHGVALEAARDAAGSRLRACFASEDAAREFWLDLYNHCLEVNLALELCDDEPGLAWTAAESAPAGSPPPSAPMVVVPPTPTASLSLIRPDIPDTPLYDILRAGDPELDRNLDATIAWIESAGLPVINLLSYLELPLFVDYAATHPEERDQNLFLHMLHTWTCYRRFGAVHARIPRALADTFTDPRYLRLNTTQFRSPSPAVCLQLPAWTYSVRPRWAKEIYLTHLEPPTPADDRELALMVVTHDERGEYGFVPLEVPLSLPAVGESIDAFFAPGLDDAELGGNNEDLRRLTAIAATWCLYASARDPALYLGQ